MSAYDRLPDAVTEIFGAEATAELSYELLTVDVAAGSWTASLETARDALKCTYFDWLSAVDEPGTGFRVCAHVVSLEDRRVRRLLLRTTVPHEAPVLASAVEVFAGAAWHERETHEMFGVVFTGHPHLVPLLLPENFEGHPLRKDFVLAARVAKAWPGAKEPGESEHGGPKRRQMLPPGVPDPNDWGPLKGQLPPAPTRQARTARAVATTGAATDRPPRRTRTAGEGSASQAAPDTTAADAAQTAAEAPGARPVRRSRSASERSASQAAPEPVAADEAAQAAPPARRSRSVSEGSASQAAPKTSAPDEAAQAAPAPAAEPPATPKTPPTRSSDAPWHHARPAFDDGKEREAEAAAAPKLEPESGSGAEPEPKSASEPAPAAEAGPKSEPEAGAKSEREAGSGAEPEPKAGPAPAAEAAPKPEPDAEAAAKAVPKPEHDAEAAAEAAAEAKAVPKPGPGAVAETGAARDPGQEPAPGPAQTPDTVSPHDADDETPPTPRRTPRSDQGPEGEPNDTTGGDPA